MRVAAVRLTSHGAVRVTQKGWTPRHYAVLNGKAVAVAELLAAGGDVNARNVSCGGCAGVRVVRVRSPWAAVDPLRPTLTYSHEL